MAPTFLGEAIVTECLLREVPCKENNDMLITLLVLILSIVFFVDGRIRADLIALCALVALMLANILSPEEALSGFSNPIVVMMIGLFIVGGGIIQTGLADTISRKIMGLAGDHPYRIYLLIVLTTAIIGSVVSNTGTVALMLPIVSSLASSTAISSRSLLMPMAFASSMGGMMTLIGTPPNLVISNELVKAGYEPLSFFSFTPVGLITVLLGVLAMWPLSRKMLSKSPQNEDRRSGGKSLGDLGQEYNITQNLYKLVVTKASAIINHRIYDLNIAQQYNVNVLEVEKKVPSRWLFAKPVVQRLVTADTSIGNNDYLYVWGDIEHVKQFAKQYGLSFVEKEADFSEKPQSVNFRFDDIGIAELVVLSNSRLVGRPLKDSGFRESYNINVLGIQRNKQYIVKNLKDEKVYAGDALLIHGNWQDIARVGENTAEFVILGQPSLEASKITIDYKAPLSAIIMVGMVMAMAFNWLPAVTAVMVAAILTVLTGCLRNVEAAYQQINWESVLLIGAMLPMSLALEKTGVSSAIAAFLVENLGSVGPVSLLGGIYLATSMLTLFLNNTATAVLFSPIALQAADAMQVSPYPFLFAVAVAASMCFASPFSTPPNALVMSAGRYRFMDYVKIGVPLQLLFALVMTFVLPMIFPF